MHADIQYLCLTHSGGPILRISSKASYAGAYASLRSSVRSAAQSSSIAPRPRFRARSRFSSSQKFEQEASSQKGLGVWSSAGDQGAEIGFLIAMVQVNTSLTLRNRVADRISAGECHQ